MKQICSIPKISYKMNGILIQGRYRNSNGGVSRITRNIPNTSSMIADITIGAWFIDLQNIPNNSIRIDLLSKTYFMKHNAYYNLFGKRL